jgi:hypothetical protein
MDELSRIRKYRDLSEGNYSGMDRLLRIGKFRDLSEGDY